MYYMYKIVVSEMNNRSSETPWMDERVSNTITIDGRWYLSCDIVHFCLRPVGNDSRFRGEPRDMIPRLRLWREWAPINDNPDEPIDWTEASDCGEPNTVTYQTTWRNRLRQYDWNENWPNDYWFVKYFFTGSDKRFRVKIRLQDEFPPHEHLFYIVPWAIS